MDVAARTTERGRRRATARRRRKPAPRTARPSESLRMLYRRGPMRVYLPALGYAYVGLALVAFAIAGDHIRAAEAFFAVAGFAYIWSLGSLRARLVRYAPDGFFASVVLLGGAASLPLQASALVSKDVEFAALGSPAAATVVVGSSLAPLHARTSPPSHGPLAIL